MPILTMVTSGRLAAARGQFWLAYYDPEYVYLLNSLLLAEGQQAWYCDHPGTTLEVFGAATTIATHLARGGETLRGDVLARPEVYLGSLHVSIRVLYAVALAGMGVLVFRLTHSLILPLLLQLTPFLASTSLWVLARATPEPLLLTLSLLVGSAVVVSAARPELAATRWFSWALGLTCGLGLATKVTFLPLLIPALLTVDQWRRKLRILAISGGTFLIVLYVGVEDAGRYFTFLSAIARHTGRYGNGPPGMMSLDEFASHLAQLSSSLYRSETAFVVAVTLSIAAVAATVLIGRRGQRHGDRRRVTRALIGVALAQLAQVLLVTKDPATPHHYLIPAFGLLGTNLALLVLLLRTGTWRWLDTLVRAAALVVIGAVLMTARGTSASLRANLEATRIDRVNAYRAGLVAGQTCRVAYAYASSSPEVALRFGNGFTGDALRFAVALQRAYPQGLFYNVWNHRFAEYTRWVPDEEVSRYPVCIAVGRGYAGQVGNDLTLEPIHETRSEILYRATYVGTKPQTTP